MGREMGLELKDQREKSQKSQDMPSSQRCSGLRQPDLPAPAGPSLSPGRSWVSAFAVGQETLGSQHSPCRAPLPSTEKGEEVDLGAQSRSGEGQTG